MINYATPRVKIYKPLEINESSEKKLQKFVNKVTKKYGLPHLDLELKMSGSLDFYACTSKSEKLILVNILFAMELNSIKEIKALLLHEIAHHFKSNKFLSVLGRRTRLKFIARHEEYRCDRFAAEHLKDSKPIQGVLNKIHTTSGSKPIKGFTNLVAAFVQETHPCTMKRIERVAKVKLNRRQNASISKILFWKKCSTE